MHEKFDFTLLKKLIKIFTEKAPYCKVGILGKHFSRADGKLTNAEIGAVHEFGTDKVPQRSFLRYPIDEFMGEEIKKLDKIKKIGPDMLEKLTYKIGAISKSIVQEGFTNNGFGTWEPTNKWAHNVLMGADIKTAGNILVDTGQLRDSIDFEVVK